MSYVTVEDALATLLKTITDFDSANVSQGDWRILGHGKAKAVVLMPGPFAREPSTVRDHNLVTWNTDIELFILWDGEQDSTVAALKTQRQLIMDEVNKFRKLNATAGVLKALVVSGGDVEPFVSPDGATFWRQVLVCETQEDEEFTRSE